MTKSQLIDRVAQKKPELPRREVEAMVNTVFEAMGLALRREERIEIRGFGTFSVRTRQERGGRNPKTGEKVRVPSRRTPRFLMSKELRDRLNPSARAASTCGAYGGPDSQATEPMAAASGTGGRYQLG